MTVCSEKLPEAEQNLPQKSKPMQIWHMIASEANQDSLVIDLELLD
jgi:hypothetical protein